MTTVTTILNEARKYIGVTQNSDVHKSIIDTYNAVKPLPVGYAVTYQDDWCDAFVTFLAIKSGATNLIGRECGVQRHIEIFKNLGIWIEDGTITPKPGDLITFNWDEWKQANDGFADHIGIVESVANNQITTIEGNTDRAVKRRTYQVGNGFIRGFARPKYANTSSSVKEKEITGIPKPVIVDISEWQVPSQINYDQLSKQVDGVIIRVQYGSNYIDKHYQTHLREFQKRGIPTAVYAWVRGTSYSDMEQEALDFYNRVKSFKPVFWWLDVEEWSMTDMRGGCERYRTKLKQLGAEKVGVYVANHLYSSFNLDVNKFDGLWVPTYGQNTGQYNGSNPTSTNKYDIHQYTDKGKLPGYSGALDLNRIVKSDKFEYLFGKKVEVPSNNKPEVTSPGVDSTSTVTKIITTIAGVKLRSAPKVADNIIADLPINSTILISGVVLSGGIVWGIQERAGNSKGYIDLGKQYSWVK